mmetsp:Transcript_24994/g.34444  ORF Transcript_24994/g.34444 Transcript_24994/m.34444 type:complete len:213 (+) Transcript_24994:300-938(+)|eukprot:CAMPEP_0196581508 /NCGR_PEP_ID=MMETSP1081-20130531/34007_1 /TAXON_ID=36882 /ORGANISM="Pyramimonas amylifera, Strain CCMP720" /LENGTH=212 /DNA_ID=CAMNT_0041901763 /DNA_START=294 /DNA_END=932 /DNA_ORIENTATION=-
MSERKRPSIRRKAPACESTKPTTQKAPAGSPGGSGGLLASLLGDLAETTKKIGTAKASNKSENISGTAATAFHQRQDFVTQIEKDLRESVLQSRDTEACMRFEPMDKKWRDLIHEVAAELRLHSVTEGDEDEKCVKVSKILDTTPPSAAATKLAAASRNTGEKKKVTLSDLAPTPDDPYSSSAVVGLNTRKRDLRSIEEIQADMKNKKERIE